MENIAVIGAGISGLTTASLLKKANFSVTVFDKGRGVGGRMSSRRTEWGYLDHGTQYFTAKQELFKQFIEQYSDLIKPWQGNFANWEKGNFIVDDSEKIRYVPRERMSNLCKQLSVDLNIHLGTRIIKLEKDKSWHLIAENGQKYSSFDLVIITAPPLQTADLLANHSPLTEKIKTVEMLPCYSLMLVPTNKLNLPYDGIQFEHPVLGWISNNKSKPNRSDFDSLIIQSNFPWANMNLEENRETIGDILKEETANIFNFTWDDFYYQSVHLWRYALPAKSSNQGYFFDKTNNLAVCGDWCLSGKVESGFLSANYLVQELLRESC